MTEVAPTNRYQEAFGAPSERARTKVVDHLDEFVQNFIRHAPLRRWPQQTVTATATRPQRGGRQGL